MKKYSVGILLILLLQASIVKAQLWNYEPTKGPPARYTFAVTSNNNEVFNTNYAGNVWRSANKGQSWILCTQPPGSVLDIKKCGNNIIAGNYISSDSGITWQSVQDVNPNTSFRKLYKDGTDVYGVTLGQTCTVYQSGNCGLNWQDITYNLVSNAQAQDIIKLDSSLFVAVNAYGIYHKKLADTSWTLRNNGLQLGVYALFGTGNLLYAATSDSGIYFSNNKGINWSRDTLLGKKFIYCLTGNDSVVYAGTQRGIYKSVVNSHVWTAVSGLPEFYPVCSIAIDGDTLFAATTTNGLFKSYDNGATFKNIHEVSLGANVSALAASDNYLFASTPTYGRFFRSSDNGNYWDCTAEISFSSLLYHNNVLYGGDISKGYIHISTDDGLTWIKSDSGLVGDVNAKTIIAINNVLFLVKDYVFKSTDNGQSWNKLTINNNETISTIAASGNNLYALSSQGVFKSSDLGSTWASVSSSFPLGTNYKNLVAGTTHLFLNTHDTIFESTNFGATWHSLPRNNMPAQYDYADLNILIIRLSLPFIHGEPMELS